MLKVSFSWDDGSPYDIKVAELFEKYEIPCKLFVPNRNVEGRDAFSGKIAVRLSIVISKRQAPINAELLH